MFRTTITAIAIPVVGATLLGAVATSASAVPADNDLFNRAKDLTHGRCNASAEGDNFDATGQPGEPVHFSAGSAPTQSVWYKWKAPRTDTTIVNTIGSDFDTILAVYRGRRVNHLSQIAADDDSGPGDLSSRLTFEARRGVTYRIAVDGFGAAQGNLLVKVKC